MTNSIRKYKRDFTFSIFIKLRKKIVFIIYKFFKNEIDRYIDKDKLLIEVKCKLNQDKYKETNKNCLIIRRKQFHGFFSDFANVLMNMHIAYKFNLIPLVDMENYPSLFQEDKLINETGNVWEYYFKQDYP